MDGRQKKSQTSFTVFRITTKNIGSNDQKKVANGFLYVISRYGLNGEKKLKKGNKKRNNHLIKGDLI
jgi:hypothetical protein